MQHICIRLSRASLSRSVLAIFVSLFARNASGVTLKHIPSEDAIVVVLNDMHMAAGDGARGVKDPFLKETKIALMQALFTLQKEAVDLGVPLIIANNGDMSYLDGTRDQQGLLPLGVSDHDLLDLNEEATLKLLNAQLVEHGNLFEFIRLLANYNGRNLYSNFATGNHDAEVYEFDKPKRAIRSRLGDEVGTKVHFNPIAPFGAADSENGLLVLHSAEHDRTAVITHFGHDAVRFTDEDGVQHDRIRADRYFVGKGRKIFDLIFSDPKRSRIRQKIFGSISGYALENTGKSVVYAPLGLFPIRIAKLYSQVIQELATIYDARRNNLDFSIQRERIDAWVEQHVDFGDKSVDDGLNDLYTLFSGLEGPNRLAYDIPVPLDWHLLYRIDRVKKLSKFIRDQVNVWTSGKRDLTPVLEYAAANGISTIIGGHTHTLAYERHTVRGRSIDVFNPGALCQTDPDQRGIHVVRMEGGNVAHNRLLAFDEGTKMFVDRDYPRQMARVDEEDSLIDGLGSTTKQWFWKRAQRWYQRRPKSPTGRK